MQPGATVTAFQPFEGHVDLFATDHDGTVWTAAFGRYPPGWGPWGPIHAYNKMTPGATAFAVLAAEDHIDLFATGADGTVLGTSYQPKKFRGWNMWAAVPQTRMAPVSTVMILKPFDRHVDLFATGPDGTVYSTFYEVTENSGRNYDQYPSISGNGPDPFAGPDPDDS